MSPTRASWSIVLRFVLLFILFTGSISVYSQTTALQFVPVTPCRVADTRNSPGPFGGPTMGPNSERDFPIPQSTCNIPSTAAAYSLNVTVAPWGSLNYLTIWPKGQQQPFVSTLNSDGRTKANAAIVPAGADQAVSVYVTDKTDVILDIDGYFVPANTSTWAFFPLTPCRVADTRNPQGPLGGPILSANQTRIFPVLDSSCNIPDSAKAYSLNMTVVPTSTLGYLTLWPTGETKPYVSTLNAPTGTVVANAAIVPAGTGAGSPVSVYVTDETHVIIDINGYFAPAASGQEPLSLFSLTPCRVLDTRPPHGSGLLYNILPINVLGSSCNVPGAQAYVFNATVAPDSGPMGYLSLWPDAEGQPYVSTLNAPDGAITSNMAIVPTLNGDVDAYVFNPAWLIMDISSYFAPILPLNITTTSLPAGTVNYGYGTTLSASGGVLPYSWALTSGSLPGGMNLNSASGLISGTPEIAGNYPFTVQVTDSETPPVSTPAQLSITVGSTLSQLTITTSTLPNGTQNSPYNTNIAATGGVTPYNWSIASGSLPPGLGLNSSTGAITGTPSGAGVTNFTVKVTDSEAPAVSATKPLSITIGPAVPLSISTTTLPNATAGTPYSVPIIAIGGVYPYTWSVTAGKIPDGLTLNSSTGVLSGTPQNVGQSNFTVQVLDAETPPVSATAQLSLIINPPGGNGNPGLLSGNYAFYMNGFNSSTQWTLAGSFISDGNGNITSGVLDGNSISGGPYTVAIGGTYSISAVNLNLMTIKGQGWGPMTLAFVLDSTGNGRIIEYDDTTGQGSRGSGVLRKANAGAFSLGALHGGYVFGMTGAIGSGTRFVDVGQFALANGSISNGTCDINQGGSFWTCNFSGNLAAINAQTGRGEATIQSNNGTSHEAVYVVSAGELVMEQIDPISNAPLLAGSVLQQSGTFNNGSLHGTAVLYAQDIHGSDGLDQSSAGIITFDGNGNDNDNIIAMDEDKAGTIQQDQPSQGTYSVGTNGAATFNCGGGGCPAGFVVSQNKAMFVGTGSNSLFGMMEPQTGGPFSNASISGSYAAGSLAPLDYTNARNEIDVASAGGNGTLNDSEDSSGSGGLDQSFGTIVNYSIASNGRGTAEAQGDQAPAVVYVISPTNFLILMPKQDARVLVFEH